MTRAADLIAALLPRKAAPILERHTGLPHGWGLWLRELPARLGHISRDKAHAFVAHFVDSPPQSPVRWQARNRWQAFRALFYQNWGPPPREERGLRAFAAVVSLVLHLLFALLLFIFALVGVSPEPPPDDAPGARVQVEYVGTGTPQEEGGGEPAPAAPAAAAAQPVPAPDMPAIAAAPAAAAPTEPQQPAAQPEPAPAPPPQAVPQPPVLAAEPSPTETRFVVPTPTLRMPVTPLPAPRTREPSVIQREVTVVDTPTLPSPVAPRPVDVPQLRQPNPQLREREVPEAVEVPQFEAPAVAASAITQPSLRSPTAQVREREVPAAVEVPQFEAPATAASAIAQPSVRPPAAQVREREIPGPKSASAPAPSAAQAAGTAQTPGTAATPAAAPANGQGNQATAKAAGPGTANRPGGAQPSTQRGDDWGVSNRNVPGQQGEAGTGQKPGLFNADGSVSVPDDLVGKTTTQPGPPGSRAAQAYDTDRANKWLERVEYPYEPTMFDKYWKPRESLLAEWVRKGIKSVEVGIPGTSKKVRCVVSLLQVGGGCGLFDPNLKEQPATARPPPEIPVKRNPIPTDS